MRNTVTSIFLVLAVGFFLGCQTTPVVKTTPAIDPEKAAIEKIFARMTETWNKGDAKGHASFWAADSKIITYSGEIFREKDPLSPERIAGIKERIEMIGKVKYMPTKVEVKGNEAFVSVDYTCSLCNRGRTGHLLVRFKLVKLNGQWKIKLQDASR